MTAFDNWQDLTYLKNGSAVQREVNGKPRVVARFTAGKWPVEIFGQPVPVNRQNGYIHMSVEARILDILGEGFRERVRLLKAEGIKTEPAFAQLLALEGDPYEALLQLEPLDRRELEALCRKSWPKLAVQRNESRIEIP
ncbi:DUF4269 domain-containing protein [Paenibacillus zanthoxyli]|uniref:DUF4269 domain-containing protein n=1 Tax=Paenibacillus zanthoxyli TaxID=369399 RepID=UPI0004705C4D|nr:DUF4269 domain-containing protein [Paenibacillus zanthoxyli]